jgi:hypothetical protein
MAALHELIPEVHLGRRSANGALGRQDEDPASLSAKNALGVNGHAAIN